MARVKEKLNTEEQIRESMKIDQEEYIKKLQEEGFFQAPKKEEEIPVRIAFADFWAKHQSKFKKGKDLEEILWAHLQAIKHDKPELFEAGLKHFGIFKE
jgi:hypothetical protein